MAQVANPRARERGGAPVPGEPPRPLELLRDLLPWALLVATILLAVT